LIELTIFRANEKLASVQKSRESEIAKLHAIQRKAEMRVTTLERTVEEKSRENRELTQICDELIAKVGK
jgi:transforming acidic coiled-coil-containing protein 3